MQRVVDVELPQKIVRACLLVVLVVALAVLFLGWGAGYTTVRTLVPGWAEMVPLTAVCFLMATVSIHLLLRSHQGGKTESKLRRTGMWLVVGVLIGLSSFELFEYPQTGAVELDFLGMTPPEGIGDGQPSVRMAATTAAGFLMTGIVLMLLQLRRARLAQAAGTVFVLLIGAFGVSGYLFGGLPLLPYSEMAVHTALSFMLLAVALAGVQSESWLTRLFNAPDANGLLVRRMFIFAVAAPILMGGVFVVGLSLDWYVLETGLGIFCVFLAFLGCVLVIITGEQLRLISATLHDQARLVEETGKIGKIGGWEYEVATGGGTWTPEVAVIHGFTNGEAIDRETCIAMARKEDRPRVETTFQRAITEAEPYDIQYGLATPSGESKWVRAQGYPVVENGKVVMVRSTVQDITKLHEAELAVRTNESRLRLIMELNPECVKVVDGQGRLTEMNRAGLEMLEVESFDEAHTQPLLDYVEPEYREVFADLHRRVMEGGEGSLEFNLKGLRGGFKRLVTHAVPLKDAQGSVQALLGITRNITEQYHKAALAEGQKEVLEMIARGRPVNDTMDKLLAFIEAAAPDMLCSILLIDKDAQCLRPCSAPRLHPDYVKATDGVKIGDTVGSCGAAAFRKEPVFVEDIATDPLWEGISEITVGFGLRACWSTPILDPSGEVLATFGVYYERPSMPTEEHLKLIEMATHTAAICLIRNQAEQELKASEWRFRRVIESIDEIFWMRDASSGKMLYVSPQYEDVWGLPITELYDDAGSWLTHVHPDDRERVRRAVINSQIREGYDETFRIIHPQKGLRWIRSRAYVYRNNQGELAGRVGVVTDLTDHKHMEDQLFRAQRLEAIGTLASGVAHDLNNILAPIMVACGMLKASLKRASDRRMIETLDKSAQRGAAIIRKLLDFSRGTEGTVSDVTPSELIREVGDLVRETFPQNIEISEMAHEKLWNLRADPSHLHQILMNLCVNARDAMPSGGRLEMRVYNCNLEQSQLTQHPDAKIGRYVMFAVEDNGEGMPPEVQARVFDPFFTTKEVGKGSGLGLASVLGIVKNYHGFVTIDSSPGKGTCVRVFLPAVGDNEEDLEPQGSKEAFRASGADKELIMIVDDEASICATIATYVRSFRYRVLTAENGKSALAILREHRHEVKLVVTDMVMPEMNGVDFLRELQREFPHVRTVATSGLVERNEILSAGLKDVDAFLEKPYLGDDLITEIQRLLPPESPAR